MTDDPEAKSKSALLERPEPGIAVVRLNRPEVRNALDLDIRKRLAEIFHSFTGFLVAQ